MWFYSVNGGGRMFTSMLFLHAIDILSDQKHVSAPTSRRLNVVVRSPPLSREVDRNGGTTTPRGQTVR